MEPKNEILINYLDSQLEPDQKIEVENMLRNQPEAATEMEYLKLAIDVVQRDAINERVNAIRKTYIHNQTVAAKPAPAVVYSLYKISLRVAAVFILVIGLTAAYKFISVNSQSLYNKQFTDFELSASRGETVDNTEMDAYRSKNWSQVIAAYSADNTKTNQSGFLAAIAEMELKNYPSAIRIFETILKSDNPSFREESEYYLSLAYLMNHQEGNGIQMLNKIKADPNHRYFPLALQISPIDLKIIQLKK